MSQVGPFTSEKNLLNAALDGRTKVSRLHKNVIADLIDQISNPTAAEMLIIQSAALKACKLYLMSEHFLNLDSYEAVSDEKALAWLNSMRQDLTALGLKRVARDISPSLDDYIGKKHKTKAEELER